MVMVSTTALDLELAARLVALGESPEDLAALARHLPDERMNETMFRRVLDLDLRHATVWLLRHSTHLTGPGTLAGDRAARPDVVAFLPRYALATHIVRRVLPFAAFGYDTEIVLGRGPAVEARRLRSFLTALGLADRVRLISGRRDLRSRLDAAGIVAVTGRISTLRHIQSRVGPERMLGAAGRCAVVIGGSDRELDRLRRALAGAPWPSCSLARVFLNGSAKASGKVSGRYRRVREENLQSDLPRLHPSIVLTTSERWVSAVRAQGYHAALVQEDGSVNGLEGFACDPVFGWPGDWML